VGEGVDVFEIQERVIADVLGSVEHRQAVEAAPKILDDVQQLAATVLQAQRNNPALPARAVDEALQTLREPLPGPTSRTCARPTRPTSTTVTWKHC
jgi:hypothetical protein